MKALTLPLSFYLKGLGHDVTAVARDHVRSLKDRDVLVIAHREQRILITNDRHFGELVLGSGFRQASS